MDDKQIHLLLIDNDAAQKKLVKSSLGEGEAAGYYLDVAKTLDKGFEYISAGGINAVIVGYESFAEKIGSAMKSIRAAAPGIPALLIIDKKDEGKLTGLAGEAPGNSGRSADPARCDCHRCLCARQTCRGPGDAESAGDERTLAAVVAG